MPSSLPKHYSCKFAKLWLASVLKQEKISCTGLSNDNEKEIFQAGLEHGVIPLVYLAARANKPLNCPDSLLEKIRKYGMQCVAAELCRHEEIERIIARLSSAGINFLLMKGSVLAHTLYPQPHLRERCDTDLLFPDKVSSEKAWEILNNEGYERRNMLEGEFVGYQFSCNRQLSGGGYCSLDIHRKLADIGFFANLFEFDELFDQSIPIPQLGSTARGLNHTYALLHACIHRIINIPLGIDENRLIWIYDMHLLCESFSDKQWLEFCELANQKKLASVCLSGLEISEHFFDTRIPPDHRRNLVESASKEHFSPHKIHNRRQLYYLDFVNNKGILNKSRQLREHLLPSVEYMTVKYDPKSRLLLPYYYVYRIIHGLFKFS